MDESDKPKYPLMTFRASEELKAAVAEFAEARGVSSSEVIRRVLDEAVGEGPSFFPDETGALLGVRSELKAIGRNLNQVARKVNSGEVKIEPLRSDELKAVMARVDDVATDIQKMATSRKARRAVLRRSARMAQ